MSCIKWKDILPNDEADFATCSGCTHNFHYNCVGIRKQYQTQEKKDKWQCDSCKVKTPPPYFDKLKFLEEIREDIKKEVRDCFQSLREEFMQEFVIIKQNVKTLEDNLDTLKKKVNSKDTIISNLSNQLAHLDQYGRGRNFEIHNVEESQDEDVEEIVVRVAQHLNVPLTKEGIEADCRLEKRGTKSSDSEDSSGRLQAISSYPGATVRSEST